MVLPAPGMMDQASEVIRTVSLDAVVMSSMPALSRRAVASFRLSRQATSSVSVKATVPFSASARCQSEIALAPPAGEHVLTLVDEMGARQRLGFVVME